MNRKSLFASAAALLLACTNLISNPAMALDELRIIAPAAPAAAGIRRRAPCRKRCSRAARSRPSPSRTCPAPAAPSGLAQLAGQEAGKDNVLMVNGLVMVGAILTNKSAVTLENTTPIARLTGEYEVIVVPAASELKTLADLVAKLKADPGSVAWGGGSAGGTDHILAGLIAKAAGADVSKLNYVPFSGGGEALAAVMGGHVVGRHQRLQRMGRPDQIGRIARACDLGARTRGRHRYTHAQGARRRCGARQLARHRRAARAR